jgi:hypothetical protein
LRSSKRWKGTYKAGQSPCRSHVERWARSWVTLAKLAARRKVRGHGMKNLGGMAIALHHRVHHLHAQRCSPVDRPICDCPRPDCIFRIKGLCCHGGKMPGCCPLVEGQSECRSQLAPAVSPASLVRVLVERALPKDGSHAVPQQAAARVARRRGKTRREREQDLPVLHAARLCARSALPPHQGNS